MPGEMFTASLSNSLGILTATGIGVSGSCITSLSMTGTLDQVNTALATLADTFPAAADRLVVSATDTLGDNAGPISIPVAAAVPILAVVAPGTATVVKGAATPIPGVCLSELGATPDETSTATLSVGAGALTATGAGVTGGNREPVHHGHTG